MSLTNTTARDDDAVAFARAMAKLLAVAGNEIERALADRFELGAVATLRAMGGA